MDEIILQLSKSFFVKRFALNKISIIMVYKNEIYDILQQYPQLKIIGDYKQTFTHQYDLELE